MLGAGKRKRSELELEIKQRESITDSILVLSKVIDQRPNQNLVSLIEAKIQKLVEKL